MSKRNSNRKSEETAEAVEELGDALEALPGGGDASADEEESANPLSRIDVSGETSFASAEFASDTETFDEEASDEDEPGVVIHDADAEDRAEAFERRRVESQAAGDGESPDDEVAPGGQPRELSELMAICEALIFVSDEPLSVKAMADVLREERGWVQVAVESLAKEFNERNAGLMLREVAGGWQFATRPEHHEHIRAYLKSKPSAKLSLAALETLAVIAYKQPVTVPEILEIRGVQSSSAIKTLLDKRLIVAKGRKETVGRPMMYGTSKEFLLQFGLRDLNELPNVEDFEDLAAGVES